MYSNFYSNVCLFLGSLKRGVQQKHPYVTFPVSKVGLDLARIFRNLGIVSAFECFQNTRRIKKNHYKRWTSQAEPSSTSELQRTPHVYVKLHINYNKFQPLYIPEGASPAEFNRGFFSALPEEVKILSSTRRPRYASCREILEERQRHGPGIFLISTDAGLVTDIEAEHYRKGGIVLGFIGLPLSMALQIRGLRRSALWEEAVLPFRERTALQDWSLSAAVRHELTSRQAEPHISPNASVGSGPDELQWLAGRPVKEQEELLAKALHELQEREDQGLQELEEHELLLQKQVVAWHKRDSLLSVDEYLTERRGLFSNDRRDNGGERGGDRRRQ